MSIYAVSVPYDKEHGEINQHFVDNESQYSAELKIEVGVSDLEVFILSVNKRLEQLYRQIA